jgi:hypothetical protein
MEEIIEEYIKNIERLENGFNESLNSVNFISYFKVYCKIRDDFFELVYNTGEHDDLYWTELCKTKDFLFDLFDKYQQPIILEEWMKNFNFWVEFKEKTIKHDRPEISEKKRQRHDEDVEEFGEYVKSQNPFSPSNMFDSTKSFYEHSWYPFGPNPSFNSPRSKSQSPLPPPPPVAAFPKTPPPPPPARYPLPPPPYMPLLSPLSISPPPPPPPPSTPPGLFETSKPTEEIAEQLWGPIKKETKSLPDVALKCKRDIVYKPPVLTNLTNEFIKKLILTKKYPPSLDFLASSQDTLSDTSSLSEKKNSKYAFSDSESDSDSDYPPLEYVDELREKENTQFVPVSPPTPPPPPPPPPPENEAETCRQQ